MRIALATWSAREAGGVEAYVAQTAAGLADAGRAVTVWHETDEPRTRPWLSIGARATCHRLADRPEEAVDAIARWAPDVVLLNGLERANLEAAIVSRFRSAFVAHNYHGTCISGTKTLQWPAPRPCERRFGAGCLLAYLPRRCGGLNAVTMVGLYRTAVVRLDTVRRCAAVITLSDHMRDEYLRHGLDPESVHCIPYAPPHARGSARLSDVDRPPVAAAGAVRLVAIARLERLKGVHIAIEALPAIASRLNRTVRLDVLGDGRERKSLERLATRCRQLDARVTVSFEGWCSAERRDRILELADVLVVPSVWPEPLGLVGYEAARFGVPAVAFDVGGIRQWLSDGVNGRVVPLRGRLAAGLADAISECVDDPSVCERLRRNARQLAVRTSAPDHIAHLSRVLDAIVCNTPEPAHACASA